MKIRNSLKTNFFNSMQNRNKVYLCILDIILAFNNIFIKSVKILKHINIIKIVYLYEI